MNDSPTRLTKIGIARRVEQLFLQGTISVTTFLEMERQCLDALTALPPSRPDQATESAPTAPFPKP